MCAVSKKSEDRTSLYYSPDGLIALKNLLCVTIKLTLEIDHRATICASRESTGFA